MFVFAMIKIISPFVDLSKVDMKARQHFSNANKYSNDTFKA